MSMIKSSYQYSQSSVLLHVEGLPDLSSGQEEGSIGIISSWRLEMVGFPSLEGKREHLESMMSTVLPYARYLVSGSPKKFGDENSPVKIEPSKNKHKIYLKSSKSNVKPLSFEIDDSGLVDLVRTLDLLRLDKRVTIEWGIPKDQPLERSELNESIPLIQRATTPLLGMGALLLFSVLSVVVPIPIEKTGIDSLNVNPTEAEELRKPVD